MATQGIQYIVSLNDPSVVSAFGRMENSALSFERSIAGMNNTLSQLGLTLGIREMYEFGKAIVETGANFEQLRFMMKIASHDAADYVANMKEAKHAVEDFKLPIEETYKSWGKLLAAVKGTNMEGAPIRSMFEDLSKVFAVMPISTEEKGRAFYAIREMFEEQVVQTRHFVRQLAITVPGILPMAEQMTGTTGAQFRKMLSEKDPNKQIKPKEFLPALFKGLAEQYATTANMSEQMGNIAPNITDITNKWKEFEDEITIKLKPELMSLFGVFKDGIGWIRENEDNIIHWGGVIADLTKIWVEYKIVMGALGLIQGAWGSAFGAQIKQTSAQTLAMSELNGQLTLVNINLETMIALLAEAGGGMSELAGIGMAGGILSSKGMNGAMNLPINIPTSTSGFTNGVATVINGAMQVGIAFFAADALAQITGVFGKKTDFGEQSSLEDIFSPSEGFGLKKALRVGAERGIHDIIQGQIPSYVGDKFKSGLGGISDVLLDAKGTDLYDIIKKTQAQLKKNGETFDIEKLFIQSDKFGNKHITNEDLYDKFLSLGYTLPFLNKNNGGQVQNGGSAAGGSSRIVPANDKIAGQRVITYNITINGGVNGQKIDKQIIEKSADFDIETIMEEVARGLESVTNDSQLHGND